MIVKYFLLFNKTLCSADLFFWLEINGLDFFHMACQVILSLCVSYYLYDLRVHKTHIKAAPIQELNSLVELDKGKGRPNR